jgi:alanine or glycine:cation symporter, AGCS family
MAWLNIIAILIRQRPSLLALRDYEAQRKAGRTPVFDPDALGIPHADLWRRSTGAEPPEASEAAPARAAGGDA